MKETLKGAFVAPDGKLRAIWRATLYYVVGTFLIFPRLDWLFARITESLHISPGLTAGDVGVGEFRNFITALICTGAFALYERRRVDSYGLPLSRAFGRQTFEGAAAGVVMAGAVALGMMVLGGMQIRGIAQSGSELALSALAGWAQISVSASPRNSGSGPISSRHYGRASASGRHPPS
jgi:hypothetical protein